MTAPVAPSVALVEAPTNLGLRPPAPGRAPGVAGMPARLRALGLADRLHPETEERVAAPNYHPARDPATGVRNAAAVAGYSRALADAVGRALDAGRFPLVVGGDCTVLLGCVLALARRGARTGSAGGRVGLAFLDGHQDLLTPASSPSGGAAGMDLALATGHGPPLLTTYDGVCPLVEPADVVLLGYRDADDVYGDPAVAPARAAMCRLGLATVRALGPAGAAARALAHWRARGVDGVWVHLDADVLDAAVMPAVDDRQPGGLSYAELGALLGPVLASGLAVGMAVTIYDPSLDPGGVAGAGLVDALVGLLRPASAAPRAYA